MEGLSKVFFGFLGSCFFISMGIYLITGFEEIKRDSGMLYVGIFFILMGLGLLVSVIASFYRFAIKGGKDDTDFSITVDLDQTISQNKYSAENLIRKVHNGRNNVVTINTKDGFSDFTGITADS